MVEPDVRLEVRELIVEFLLQQLPRLEPNVVIAHRKPSESLWKREIFLQSKTTFTTVFSIPVRGR